MCLTRYLKKDNTAVNSHDSYTCRSESTACTCEVNTVLLNTKSTFITLRQLAKQVATMLSAFTFSRRSLPTDILGLPIFMIVEEEQLSNTAV